MKRFLSCLQVTQDEFKMTYQAIGFLLKKKSTFEQTTVTQLFRKVWVGSLETGSEEGEKQQQP